MQYNETWSARVGIDASRHLWRSMRLRMGSVFFLFAYAASYVAVRDRWHLAVGAALICVGFLLGSLVEFHLFYTASSRAIGVQVRFGFGRGIPSRESEYLAWCERRNIQPNPFAESDR